jgi:hypothetical protein
MFFRRTARPEAMRAPIAAIAVIFVEVFRPGANIYPSSASEKTEISMRTSMCSALAVAIVAISGSAWAQVAAPASTTVAAAVAKVRFDLDTPIAVIAADPAGKAVLDKDLPGLTTHPMYEAFKNDTLKQFQPKTGGAITKDILAVTEKDLAALDTSQSR